MERELAAAEPFASPGASYEVIAPQDPATILKWAGAEFERLAIATSFQGSGLVILHLLRDIKPDLPIFFLDTGFHFEETLAFRDRIAEMWGLTVTTLRGRFPSAEDQARALGPELYRRDPNLCCHINKVAPLQEALEGFDAWISGIRRDQSPLRTGTPVLEAQVLPTGREILKVHPLAHWSRDDVQAYLSENGIPTHPLLESGFASIGCRPCTRAVRAGEDERAGRWDGFTKTECGIHTFGKRGRDTEAEQ